MTTQIYNGYNMSLVGGMQIGDLYMAHNASGTYVCVAKGERMKYSSWRDATEEEVMSYWEKYATQMAYSDED